MNKSDSIKNLAVALAKFQGEVRNAPKSANNPFFKSKYTPLDVVVDHIRPILEKNGLSYIQSCGGDGSVVTVTTLILHESGEWIETDALALKADKVTAQGAGSAITYARRYALTAAFGIASDEDDDGNNVSGNDKQIKCTVCNKIITGTDKHTASEVAKRSKDSCGKEMCIECGKKAAAAAKAGK